MKIVRKRRVVHDGWIVTAFWLDRLDDRIVGTWEGPNSSTVAEEVRAIGGGWTAEERDAELVGTTLDAIRVELEGFAPPAPEGEANG